MVKVGTWLLYGDGDNKCNDLTVTCLQIVVLVRLRIQVLKYAALQFTS